MLVTGNNSLSTYRLSIRIYADGFSLYIHYPDGTLLQKEDTKSDGVTPFHEQIKQALTHPHTTEYNYGSIEIVSTSQSTLVPLEYFRREEAIPLYKLTFPASKVGNDEVHYQILPTLEVVELFSLSKQVMDTVRSIYPNAQVVSLEGQTLESIHNIDYRRQDNATHLYSLQAESHTLIAVFKDERLLYASTYDVEGDDDRLYYLIGVWKNLKLDGERDVCMLCNASTELLTQVRRFIPKTETCEL